jgi:hypothetical protein
MPASIFLWDQLALSAGILALIYVATLRSTTAVAVSLSPATLTGWGEALLPGEVGITLKRIEHGAAIDKE